MARDEDDQVEQEHGLGFSDIIPSGKDKDLGKGIWDACSVLVTLRRVC